MMSIERKANSLLEEAKSLASNVKSWADFSASLFDQSSGLVAKGFPDEFERQTFYDSPQYREINQILVGLMSKFGVYEGANPSKASGKFVVRVPKTTHQCLKIEAKREGISLNQLASVKLSVPLRESSGLPADLLIEAFNEVHQGYSQDWVIVDPDCNVRFLEKCREFGLTNSDWSLNQTLMNIRKSSKYKGRLNPSTKRTGFDDYDNYAFASEISVRILQRTDGVTLDRILCDPALRQQFDRFAQHLSPEKSVVKLRCAALNLRKTHRLQPLASNASTFDLVSTGPFDRLDLSGVSDFPGTYVFYDGARPIFAGETENLKKRIKIHREAGLPDWLEVKDDNFTLKVAVIPKAKRDIRLDWLGWFINRERPLLNYQKAS